MSTFILGLVAASLTTIAYVPQVVKNVEIQILQGFVAEDAVDFLYRHNLVVNLWNYGERYSDYSS
jgi:beta-lactam-binding protein with PASTA domain